MKALLSGAPEVSEDDYTLHRIRNGVPEGMIDMADGLPMERIADMMGGGLSVSCFLYQ